jgi:hypothetical protein
MKKQDVDYFSSRRLAKKGREMRKKYANFLVFNNRLNWMGKASMIDKIKSQSFQHQDAVDNK